MSSILPNIFSKNRVYVPVRPPTRVLKEKKSKARNVRDLENGHDLGPEIDLDLEKGPVEGHELDLENELGEDHDLGVDLENVLEGDLDLAQRRKVAKRGTKRSGFQHMKNWYLFIILLQMLLRDLNNLHLVG
jgi:hypothetical protein